MDSSAMDCKEIQKFIHAFLDGEFGQQERALVEAHLGSCERCRRQAQIEERFRQSLRQAHHPVQAPPRLRQRVQRGLAAEDQRRRRRVLLRWVAAPAAAAALLLVGVSASVKWYGPGLPSLAEESISWHRQRVPMDVSGPKPAPVRRYFSNKVPFAVRPPTFQDPRAKLVGARLSNLGPRRAAYLVYRVNGRRVSVFITDPAAIPSTGNAIQVGNRRMHMQGRQGYNVLTYVSGGTGYTVTSDMDQDSMVRLISDVQ